jgi:hypothetical protein
MDNHADKFTTPVKEFQPRINKRKNVVSKLSESGVYEAPRSRKNSARGSESLNNTLNQELAKQKYSEFMKSSRENQNENEDIDAEFDYELENIDQNKNQSKQKLNSSTLNASHTSLNKSLRQSGPVQNIDARKTAEKYFFKNCLAHF